jgi:hypothetical protein
MSATELRAYMLAQAHMIEDAWEQSDRSQSLDTFAVNWINTYGALLRSTSEV